MNTLITLLEAISLIHTLALQFLRCNILRPSVVDSPSSADSLGDLSRGDLSLGDLSLGDLSLGDLSLGDLSLGDLSLGDLSLGDLSLGDLSLGDLFLGDFSLGEALSFVLLRPESLLPELGRSTEEMDLARESLEVLSGDWSRSESFFLANLSKETSETSEGFFFESESVRVNGGAVVLVVLVFVVFVFCASVSVSLACAALPNSACLRFCSSSFQKSLLSENRECVRLIA